jgi:hypothetical protein
MALGIIRLLKRMEVNVNKLFFSKISKLCDTKLISMVMVLVVILDFVLIGVEDNFSVGLFDWR